MKKPSDFLVKIYQLINLFDKDDELWWERRELERKESDLQSAIQQKIKEILAIPPR